MEYLCTEWLLSKDSAWGVIQIKKFVAMAMRHTNISLKIFLCDESACSEKYHFKSMEDAQIPALCDVYMRQSAVLLFRMPTSFDASVLFGQYEADSKKILNRSSIVRDIFHAPIELDSWWDIQRQETLLAVFHDGEPLVTIVRV